MTAEAENKILTYIDSQLEERRTEGYRKLAEEISKSIKDAARGPKYTIDAEVDGEGCFKMTAHKAD